MSDRSVLSLPGAVLVTAGLLAALSTSVPAQESAEADEALLKAAGVATDADGLLDFFRKRTLKEEDRARLAALVKQLGSTNYRERDRATRGLLAQGRPAVPLLKDALAGVPLEATRRAELLIKKIEGGPGPELPAAAARLLALRRPAGAIDALFNFLPHADDDWVREEVLTALGRLAVRPGAADARLLAALKSDRPEQRQAAAYVLARHGDLEVRDPVRQLLDDAELRPSAAAGLLGKETLHGLRDAAPSDEALLRTHKLAVDETALLDFLRKHTPGEADLERLRGLVRQLGSPSYKARQEASRKLAETGPTALNFLKEAAASGDTEVSRRAQLCLEEIRKGPGPALPAAAVRLLARTPSGPDHSPGAAVRVLLGYLPFAEDEAVEEHALTALTVLSVREARLDPLLPAALGDPLPARRAGAAFVLGRVGGREHCLAVRKGLEDPSPAVRLRAAQGLLAAGDRAAVPALIGLVTEAPAPALWKLEEQLRRLAGNKAPAEPVVEATPEARQRVAKAWERWWHEQGSALDLTRPSEAPGFLGLTTICEYDSAVGQPGGQVWECGRDGKPRWKITGLLGAMDAQVLPNGRVLVAENSAQRVTERDPATGAVKWHHMVPGNPIAVQRLPNGNTFIATYQNLMEVTPANKVVYDHRPGPQFYIFSARRQKNGHVLAMTAQGVLLEVDPVSGKQVRTIPTGANGGWCSAEALPNGRYLVATMNNGQVREIDAANKTHWSASVPGVFRATRLPNGHTLVASMTTRKVAELDRAGAVRWEKACEGRPWAVRYR